MNKKNVKVTFTTTSDVKKSRWSPRELVDWLLSSHIHYIISHIHQGLNSLFWNMDELYNEIKRLRFHIGFPYLQKINCPIFTQNKLAYLQCLPDLTNPTLRIELLENCDYRAVIPEIER